MALTITGAGLARTAHAASCESGEPATFSLMAHMGGTASEEIDAPLDEVWAVVEDVLSAPDWQDGLVAMTDLETHGGGRGTRGERENHIKVRSVKSQVRFRYEAPDRLSWEQVKGDLK